MATRRVLEIVCILHLVLVRVSESREWSYGLEEEDGQERWFEKYPQCGGTQQSPIEIWLHDLDIQAYTSEDNGVRLHNYDNPIMNSTILNNGRSVVVTIPTQQDITMSAGHLPGRFKLAQMHFHWGQQEDGLEGSEHTIGRGRYPLELHLVHVNEVTKKPEAVLGVFFQLIDPHLPDPPPSNPQIEGIVKHFHGIRRGRTFGQISDYIRVSDLLPRNRHNYVFYHGSLTTPPCTEGILWTIFTQVQYITADQLQQFRSLRGDLETDTVGDNYRLTQPLNGRKVTLYTYQPILVSSAETKRLPFWIATVSVILLRLVSTC